MANTDEINKKTQGKILAEIYRLISFINPKYAEYYSLDTAIYGLDHGVERVINRELNNGEAFHNFVTEEEEKIIIDYLNQYFIPEENMKNFPTSSLDAEHYLSKYGISMHQFRIVCENFVMEGRYLEMFQKMESWQTEYRNIGTLAKEKLAGKTNLNIMKDKYNYTFANFTLSENRTLKGAVLRQGYNF